MMIVIFLKQKIAEEHQRKKESEETIYWHVPSSSTDA
jgi:hypothetical protein